MNTEFRIELPLAPSRVVNRILLEGQSARAQGTPVNKCPYMSPTLADIWREGWHG